MVTSVSTSTDEPALVLAGRDPETAREVTVQMALVGEPGGRRGRGDRLARPEQAARHADAVGDGERVRRPSRPLAEQADQAELADAGGRRELVESDVALRIHGQV